MIVDHLDVEDTLRGETVDAGTPSVKVYSAEERQALIAQLQDGVSAPRCPHCAGACTVLQIPARSDVAYVRRRVVVRCGACLRSLGVESHEVEDRRGR